MNHDGLDDVVFANGATLQVVYGRTQDTNFSLADVASNASLGYQVTGLPQGAAHVADAGDFNGDGIDDFIVGSPGALGEAAYLIFGSDSGLNIDVTNIMAGTANGFAITNAAGDGDSAGFSNHGHLGEAVSSAGDINGDGFDDLLVSAPYFEQYDYYGENALGSGEYEATAKGATYVIFGNDGGDNSAIDIATVTNTTQPTVTVDHDGTTGADNLSGFDRAELFVGDLGNDTITGGGGADVVLAGAGDDEVIINASNIAALEGGSQFGKLSHLEGGNGTDMLVLDGSGLTLDFGNIDDGRVENFEVIDITGSGNNALEIGLEDLLHLSDTSDTFRILGDVGDTIEVSGMSTAAHTTTTDPSDGKTYEVYTLGHETLEIHDEIAISII